MATFPGGIAHGRQPVSGIANVRANIPISAVAVAFNNSVPGSGDWRACHGLARLGRPAKGAVLAARPHGISRDRQCKTEVTAGIADVPECTSTISADGSISGGMQWWADHGVTSFGRSAKAFVATRTRGVTCDRQHVAWVAGRGADAAENCSVARASDSSVQGGKNRRTRHRPSAGTGRRVAQASSQASGDADSDGNSSGDKDAKENDTSAAATRTTVCIQGYVLNGSSRNDTVPCCHATAVTRRRGRNA